jgi:hypothetical protein
MTLNWSFLDFLAEPAFVLSWYAIGLIGAVWVLYDEYRLNTQVNAALKWAWPIIISFFSVVGIALYIWTCRPPRIGPKHGEEEKKAHHAYVTTDFRRVTGSVIHCVGGDGLGIITAMVIARLLDMAFWTEFWFEYAVGFAFGWFIFQYKAMSKMADSKATALWMGGRAEFFSMMTVMAGMGVVMAYVTPLVIGEQPDPVTFGFWGFAALGLFLGFVVTYPMNWWLVQIGWKHGMS